MSDGTCRICGGPLPAMRAPGRKRIYCSETCRVSQYRSKAERAPRPCRSCGSVISMLPKQQYCSHSCGDAESKRRRSSKLESHYTCHGCDVEVDRGRPTKGQPPKWCESCRRERRRIEIRKSVRLAVYERDGWICQICFDPVDPTLPPMSPWRPSIDHFACRSWSDVPDNSMENLRLAHKWCNSVRADERFYTDEDIGGCDGNSRSNTEAIRQEAGTHVQG